MIPETGKDLEVYVDAKFSGNWDKYESLYKDTAESRHGCIIMYDRCPLVWKYQLKTEIILSSTES